MAVVIVDSFLLRGVQPSAIEESLLSGGYAEIHLPEVKVELIDGAKPRGIAEKEKRKNVVHYWSNKDVAQSLGVSRAPGKYCDWCRRPIKDADGEKQHMGMPIAAPLSNGDLPQVGTYDTWNCMYTDALREESMPAGLRTQVYDETRTLIERIYQELYPGKKPGIARHWSKLSCNGGYMSDKEYDENLVYVSKMAQYRPLACVIVDQISDPHE